MNPFAAHLALPRTGAVTAPADDAVTGKRQLQMWLLAMGVVAVGSAVVAYKSKPGSLLRSASVGASVGSLLGATYLFGADTALRRIAAAASPAAPPAPTTLPAQFPGGILIPAPTQTTGPSAQPPPTTMTPPVVAPPISIPKTPAEVTALASYRATIAQAKHSLGSVTLEQLRRQATNARISGFIAEATQLDQLAAARLGVVPGANPPITSSSIGCTAQSGVLPSSAITQAQALLALDPKSTDFRTQATLSSVATMRELAAQIRFCGSALGPQSDRDTLATALEQKALSNETVLMAGVSPGEHSAVFIPEINGSKLTPGRIVIVDPQIAGDLPAGRYKITGAIVGGLGGTIPAENAKGDAVALRIMSITKLVGPDL